MILIAAALMITVIVWGLMRVEIAGLSLTTMKSQSAITNIPCGHRATSQKDSFPNLNGSSITS
jgi:hypothetical protein